MSDEFDRPDGLSPGGRRWSNRPPALPHWPARSAAAPPAARFRAARRKAEAQYQAHPSGLERCGVCKHFIPLTGCEIVAAPVQANGWCKYYKLF